METVLLVLVSILLAVIVLLLLKRPGSPGSPRPDLAPDLLAAQLTDLGALKTQVETIASAQLKLPDKFASLETAMKGLETKVVESTGGAKDSVIREVQETRRALDTLKTEFDSRKQLESELRESSRRIEAVIAGGRSRGKAGEDILAEAFKQFPPNVIESNFRIKGQAAEYALVLADGKRVPIDSKWTSPELVERLESESDPVKREELVRQIEAAMQGKVKEVAKYVDPSLTISWGIAAVPDSIYAVCRRPHLDAFRQNVVVMPYSLAVIYLLSLYHLHLQYCRSVDVEKLEGYLNQIERGLAAIDNALENKIARGNTMVSNAFNECKRTIGELQGATASLRALPAGSEPRQIESEHTGGAG